MTEQYVELHCRSAFSFLRGASRPKELALRAAHLGLPAVALCDRDGLYGAPQFFSYAREAGIQPIVGAELTMEDKTILPVLVQSRAGYENLCPLLTRAHLRSEKGKCNVRWDELPEFAGGLVALAAFPTAHRNIGLESPVNPQTGKPALRGVEHLCEIFGRDNLFVEIQRHRIRGEEHANKARVELARHFGLPLLATNGVIYASETERPILDVFTCIRNHTHLDAAGTLLEQNAERHLKSAAQMCELFRDLPEAITNTVRLAERLNFTLENLGYEFPAYPVKTGETMDKVLREKAFAGAIKRYNRIPHKVRMQLEQELQLIEKLKVAGYFLIVWDIIEFCRENDIMAQGRGSAANSTVCFCLGITAVDPLRFETLFERFLTEGRKQCWPDIDIDLPSGDRREKVIQEIYKRYGQHGAAMTANVITYRGRSAAREVGKALNLSSDVLNRFSSLYANGDFPHTIDLPAQMEKSGLPKTHPRAEAFVRLCSDIKGLPRHLGQHSGGMIICQDKLNRIVPLENASMPGRVVAQWDKDDCEALGIIKVDFLGLGMMSVLQDTVKLTHDLGRPIDIASLPKDDPESYRMMQQADTIGLFQIESRAQMATLPRMKPTKFYDLVIEVAVVRPGPIHGDLMHPYLKRRKQVEQGADPDEMPCYHKDLKSVLRRTLGIPLFQEQMLKMAMVMADFTGAEAEELRSALSFHRSQEKMERVKIKLCEAMQRKGHSEALIEEIIKTVSSFALYGFPESHAISFAHLAYASAYLKAHRAPEFYTSLLNNQPMGFYSSATLIKDGQRHGVKFLPVCVMISEWDCVIEHPPKHRTGTSGGPAGWKACATDYPIRLGLRVVKTLSGTGAKRLVEERKKKPFASLIDFKRRVRLNKDELRTLAEIGALNCFAAHRREALWEVEKPLRQDDLFEGNTTAENTAAVIDRRYNDVSPLAAMSYPERIQADFAGMQLTTGAHPMALLRSRLAGILRAADLPTAKHGSMVRIAGNVICRQRPGTAKGFVFVSLEDETGISNAIVTPPMFEANRLVITEEPFLTIEGRLQHINGVIHIKAQRIERLEYDPAVASRSYDFH
ncbi:MAG TPA: error-prone DNA polymerase [Verrucomicrobiae bacterium]|jgi:error-prone DNA polymerase|nr:error-prone DNA polymerase [Verrucomicrobiae bacterium]